MTMNGNFARDPCFFSSWELVVLCMGSVLSLLCACLVLWLSWWLKLPSNLRLAIQQHRAFTLAAFFVSFLVLLLSCISSLDLILPSMSSATWCALSHAVWTMSEGWQMYRALVRKEHSNSLNNRLSWLHLFCIYAPALLITLLPLILRGSIFVPTIFFYETLFPDVNFSDAFWDHLHGKFLILLWLNLLFLGPMVLFNLIILCLVLRSIQNRSKMLEEVSKCSQVLPSPKNALAVLALSSVLGLNMAVEAFIFLPIPALALLGRLAMISAGAIFLAQFIFCNGAVKKALCAKLPWLAKMRENRTSTNQQETECPTTNLTTTSV